MSGSTILNITFDCADTAAVAAFWSAVTGWPAEPVDMPGNPYWLVAPPEGGTPRLVFVEVPEPGPAKNRVHLDLLPVDGSQADEVARIESLGGRVVDGRRTATPGGWVVMADPEGHELCVEAGGDE